MIVGLPAPEAVSQRVLDRIDASAPPIDLERIVSTWKNLYVVEEELDGAGYLLPVGQLGAEIIVNKNTSFERKRFTVAHELGHWVLGLMAKNKFGKFKQPEHVPDAALEKWCDEFATNLLMPRTLLGSWLPEPTKAAFIDLVLKAKDDFKVSDQAFFIRIWELFQVQVLMVRVLQSSGEKVHLKIEKNFGEKGSETRADELLRHRDVGIQFRIQTTGVFFSAKSPLGPVFCSGKQVATDKYLVAIIWPGALSQRTAKSAGAPRPPGGADKPSR